METILHQSAPISFVQNTTKASVLSRFMAWCEGQEKYRFGWLAAALSIHGCALTPITLFAIILAGTNIVFFVLALVAMSMALVTNLAAMPTKSYHTGFLLKCCYRYCYNYFLRSNWL